jgi:hypothetical protein
MSRRRHKALENIAGAFGLACIILALTTNHLGPAMDGYFGWQTAEAIYREVFFLGPVVERWHRFAETTLILGTIGLAISLALSFIARARDRNASR